MNSPINQQRSSRRDISSADWSHLRPTITELYQNQRWTMNQVRLHLEETGYRVTTRMVRARITQWNLHRNHQLRDMAAALRLLDLDPGLWPSPEPSFLIRGRPVKLKEILHFFRRKGIRDPLHWARSTAADSEEPHVRLIGDEEHLSDEASPESEEKMQAAGSQASAIQIYQLANHPLTIDERAVATLQDYCSAYIKLKHNWHQEPRVHQFTTHGQFGERMRDGLAHMMSNSPEAFPNFRYGFELVHDLLSDCHPMALGQYLTIVCTLATHQAYPVLSSLLRYTSMMASTLGVQNSVVAFLAAMSTSQDALFTAIVCLRAAVGVFAEQTDISWQKHYLQERLCDCLYYGKSYAEGSTYRARLFQEQERVYGNGARNVLFTLSNVASDYLLMGDIDNAQAQYTLVLRRSKALTGLGLAKIRFAALEGLALCEQTRFEKKWQDTSDTIGDLPVIPLLNALRYIQKALSEATTWFEPCSRRTLRALECQTQVANLLATVSPNLM